MSVAREDALLLRRLLVKGPVAIARDVTTLRHQPVPRAQCHRQSTGQRIKRRSCMVGAHFDSWDPAQGANDDGEGVAGNPRKTLTPLTSLGAAGVSLDATFDQDHGPFVVVGVPAFSLHVEPAQSDIHHQPSPTRTTTSTRGCWPSTLRDGRGRVVVRRRPNPVGRRVSEAGGRGSDEKERRRIDATDAVRGIPTLIGGDQLHCGA